MPSTPTILLSLGHVLNVMAVYHYTIVICLILVVFCILSVNKSTDYSGKIVLEFQTGNKNRGSKHEESPYKPLLLKLQHGFVRINIFPRSRRMDEVQVDIINIKPARSLSVSENL